MPSSSWRRHKTRTQVGRTCCKQFTMCFVFRPVVCSGAAHVAAAKQQLEAAWDEDTGGDWIHAGCPCVYALNFSHL